MGGVECGAFELSSVASVGDIREMSKASRPCLRRPTCPTPSRHSFPLGMKKNILLPRLARAPPSAAVFPFHLLEKQIAKSLF